MTDYKERKIGYEWGALGERTEITYPDGRKVQYTYDADSHLIGKQFPNGIKTTYHYNRRGQLESLAIFEKKFNTNGAK